MITVCLRSLTENWDGKLIAVIVSGFEGDGAAALHGIKEVGGILSKNQNQSASRLSRLFTQESIPIPTRPRENRQLSHSAGGENGRQAWCPV